MELSEFREGMNRLVHTFAPPKWNEDREFAYYQAFQHFDAERWSLVVTRAIDTCERFPSPSVLKGQARDDEKRGKAWTRPGCTQCEDGMVRFKVQSEAGVEYEKYKACSCPAGDRVAEHMVQIARLKGRNDATPEQMRYRPPEAPPWVDDYRRESVEEGLPF